MGVTLMLDERELAHPHIGLAQIDPELLGEIHQLLASPVKELGIGRKRHILGLDRRIDNHPPGVGRLHRAGLHRDREALLKQCDDLLFAHALTPAGERGAIKRQDVAEELFPAQILKIRVLNPPCAQLLIRQVEGMLEDGKARHQPGRQGRHARTITIGFAEATLQEPPVDRSRELHQFVAHIDDLIES